MNWKAIRLELARTSDFPNGSASRAYLMRLPLRDDGAIDEGALDEAPEQATVVDEGANEVSFFPADHRLVEGPAGGIAVYA